jgi:hypothetical protein
MILEIVNIYARPSDGELDVVAKCPKCGYYHKLGVDWLKSIGPNFKCPTCFSVSRVPSVEMRERIAS